MQESTYLKVLEGGFPIADDDKRSRSFRRFSRIKRGSGFCWCRVKTNACSALMCHVARLTQLAIPGICTGSIHFAIGRKTSCRLSSEADHPNERTHDSPQQRRVCLSIATNRFQYSLSIRNPSFQTSLNYGKKMERYLAEIRLDYLLLPRTPR